KPLKILLIGLGDVQRGLRMISLAQRYRTTEAIHFAGIDRFDSRQENLSRLSLKEAHTLLRPTGARIHLLPGDPHEALPLAANAFHGYDFALIAADQRADSLSGAWFFLNRLLGPDACVLREEARSATPLLTHISRTELARWAAEAAPRR